MDSHGFHGVFIHHLMMIFIMGNDDWIITMGVPSIQSWTYLDDQVLEDDLEDLEELERSLKAAACGLLGCWTAGAVAW